MQDNYLQKISDRYQVSQIMKINEESKENGLVLSEEEATALVEAKRDTLREERRVEFGDSISPKLIRTFSDSSFINQEDYPTQVPVEGKTGIDAIEEYIDKIAAEQRFLAKFPPGYVEELLRSYTSDYKDQFFNLSEIVINKCKTDPIE